VPLPDVKEVSLPGLKRSNTSVSATLTCSPLIVIYGVYNFNG
jgi:hypothetical protein